MIQKEIVDKVVFKIVKEQFDDWDWRTYKRVTDTRTLAMGFNEDKTSIVWAICDYKSDCVTIVVEQDDEIQTSAIYTLDQIMEVL